MKGNYQKLNVFIRYENGVVTCMCLRRNRKCLHYCEKETVLRDKYFGWIDTFKQDKYGKSKL